MLLFANTVKKLLFGLFVVACLSACPQITKDTQTEDMVNAFFQALETGDFHKAYDDLFNRMLSPLAPKASMQIKQQSAIGLKKGGEVIEYTLQQRNDISHNLIHLRYLLSQSVQPSIWDFYFYKPKDKWFLIKMTSSNELALLH